MQTDNFTFYAWRLSWYSAKVRSYLQYKGIPFSEVKPSLYTFRRTIVKHCGDAAVPVLVTPEGKWLMDSSSIIEDMESRFPVAPAYPATPVQGFFSALVELWADEYWHPTTLHYRFSFPENFPVWRDEIGTLLRGLPRFARNIVVGHYYKFMRGVTDDAGGVTPQTTGLIESWTENQLDMLDQHFSTMPFLLGERATLGDYALMGPIFGHLAWDKYSKTAVIEPRKNLSAWIERMSTLATHDGDLVGEDKIPEALQPMVGSLVDELIPYLECCVQDLPNLKPTSETGPCYQRFGSRVEIPYGDGTLKRVVMPYALWMLQRVLDRYSRMSDSDAAAVRDWLRAVGGERLLELEFPRLRRIGLNVAPELHCLFSCNPG